MEMLSSLKEKILNVSLFTNTEEHSKRKSVNINAGAEILAHYQNQWEELHGINEENAAKAAKVAEEIEKISIFIDDNKTNISLINHIVQNSNLLTNLNKCLDNIKDLYNVSETLENDLIKLEDLIDQADFEKMKNRHKYHLEQYKRKKEDTLANIKVDLEEKHIKKIKEYETSKKAIMKERQEVFQDAFKNDLETYKNSGTVPLKIQQKNQNGALLEEIQLDFDEKELDQFFNDENKI